jgi:cobalt-zinc-cadmium efflux system protein
LICINTRPWAFHFSPIVNNGQVSTSVRLRVLLSLNLALVSGLIVVGLSANSLGVLAAGFDYLGDAAAITTSLLAIWLRHRPPTSKRPQGYPRATVVAALINSAWLSILSLLVIIGAIQRLVRGTPSVHGLPVVIVSCIASAVLFLGGIFLRGRDGDDSDNDLNLRAILLDTLGDASAAAGVAISGGIILATSGNDWLDPMVALLIAIVIGYHAVKLVSEITSELKKAPPADQ